MVRVASSSFIASALFLVDTRVEPGTWWLGQRLEPGCRGAILPRLAARFQSAGSALQDRALAGGGLCRADGSFLCANLQTEMWVDPGILGNSFPCIVIGALYACSNRAVRLVDRFATNRLVVSAVLLLLVEPFAASNSARGRAAGSRSTQR